MMPVRSPVVAGQFYPDSPDECRAQIRQCLTDAERLVPAELPAGFLPIGGIAPHAGWVCSGAVAALVIRLLAGDQAAKPSDRPVETFIVFGAAHRPLHSAAALYDRGAWQTPLGDAVIDEALAAQMIRSGPLVPADPRVHSFEHSIEVEVPFIQYFAPTAKLVPVMVSPVAPPSTSAGSPPARPRTWAGGLPSSARPT